MWRIVHDVRRALTNMYGMLMSISKKCLLVPPNPADDISCVDL